MKGLYGRSLDNSLKWDLESPFGGGYHVYMFWYMLNAICDLWILYEVTVKLMKGLLYGYGMFTVKLSKML